MSQLPAEPGFCPADFCCRRAFPDIRGIWKPARASRQVLCKKGLIRGVDGGMGHPRSRGKEGPGRAPQRTETMGTKLRPTVPAVVEPEIMMLAQDGQPGGSGNTGQPVGQKNIPSKPEVVRPNQCLLWRKPGEKPEDLSSGVHPIRSACREICESRFDPDGKPNPFDQGALNLLRPHLIGSLPHSQRDGLKSSRRGQRRQEHFNNPSDSPRAQMVMQDQQVLRDGPVIRHPDIRFPSTTDHAGQHASFGKKRKEANNRKLGCQATAGSLFQKNPESCLHPVRDRT